MFHTFGAHGSVFGAVCLVASVETQRTQGLVFRLSWMEYVALICFDGVTQLESSQFLNTFFRFFYLRCSQMYQSVLNARID